MKRSSETSGRAGVVLAGTLGAARRADAPASRSFMTLPGAAVASPGCWMKLTRSRGNRRLARVKTSVTRVSTRRSAVAVGRTSRALRRARSQLAGGPVTLCRSTERQPVIDVTSRRARVRPRGARLRSCWTRRMARVQHLT